MNRRSNFESVDERDGTISIADEGEASSPTEEPCQPRSQRTSTCLPNRNSFRLTMLLLLCCIGLLTAILCLCYPQHAFSFDRVSSSPGDFTSDSAALVSSSYRELSRSELTEINCPREVEVSPHDEYELVEDNYRCFADHNCVSGDCFSVRGTGYCLSAVGFPEGHPCSEDRNCAVSLKCHRSGICLSPKSKQDSAKFPLQLVLEPNVNPDDFNDFMSSYFSFIDFPFASSLSPRPTFTKPLTIILYPNIYSVNNLELLSENVIRYLKKQQSVIRPNERLYLIYGHSSSSEKHCEFAETDSSFQEDISVFEEEFNRQLPRSFLSSFSVEFKEVVEMMYTSDVSGRKTLNCEKNQATEFEEFWNVLFSEIEDDTTMSIDSDLPDWSTPSHRRRKQRIGNDAKRICYQMIRTVIPNGKKGDTCDGSALLSSRVPTSSPLLFNLCVMLGILSLLVLSFHIIVGMRSTPKTKNEEGEGEQNAEKMLLMQIKDGMERMRPAVLFYWTHHLGKDRRVEKEAEGEGEEHSEESIEEETEGVGVGGEFGEGRIQ